MTMFDEIQKTKNVSEKYLEKLGAKFKKENVGKTVIIFPYIKEHVVVDDPIKANDITSQSKYQKEVSFMVNL